MCLQLVSSNSLFVSIIKFPMLWTKGSPENKDAALNQIEQ